ncbi:golgin subfamily a member 6-like protein 22 isoform x3 [Plakobranchus ocellatus]|uniref:Golgin subfamily a member 6-like protein 22 isoform x3 n=1 Tax=Plakobranchus ocellatus TaxID=259542 RepID=A0AAV4CQU0_9GAST|nr:golgin subfamily a member 6-like protein 22 isoform x3 [Plakobranchus ocellatus]
MADLLRDDRSSKSDAASQSSNEDDGFHAAEQELQDHIISIYGSAEPNNDMFRPALADSAKIGFFSLDRASQTEVTEIVDLKEMTEVLQILLQDVANLRRDINFTKHVMRADHESKLKEKSLELYCRINEKVVELEKMHQDRVNSLRKAFRQQLADAISRLSVHFSKNLHIKMVRERTKQKSDMAGKEETFKEMQATILRNEGVIQMLKAQLQQQQMRQREDEDERFMDRRLIMDESSPRVDSALQEQLTATQEELEEANQKLEKSSKKLARLEEALDIKDEEIMTLNKEMDAVKEQIERSDIMVEQLKHEQNEQLEAAAKEREISKKLMGNQKEEMKRMMDEQIRLAKEEAMEKMKEENHKLQSGEQAKLNKMKSQIADLEKQLAKEKEKSSTLMTQDSASSKTMKESEDKLRAEISRLNSELEKAHRTWEKKFAILQQRSEIRWGAAEDLLTTAFHSSQSSAFRKVFLSSSPVHSLMLSSQRFFCLPLLLPPFSVPCMMVLARPDERVVCPYYFSFHCRTMVRRSSCGSMAFSILILTSPFVV